MSRLLALLSLGALAAPALHAQAVPTTISYQGALTEPDGDPVPDGTYTVALRLFTAASGGLSSYAETHTVTTVGGVFSAELGAGTPTTGTWANVTFDKGYWLETAVNGTTFGPRTKLLAGPYARALTLPYAASVSQTGSLLALTNATGSGLRGESGSATGAGVAGYATSATGVSYGGFFRAASTSAQAVFAQATATSGSAYGVRATSASTSGAGVYGSAGASSGTTYGVYGSASSTGGRGVYGGATATSGTNYGGYFETASTTGRGVFAWATSSTGANTGVWGRSTSSTGTGARGEATATSGVNYGGYFTTASASGYGLYANNSTASGIAAYFGDKVRGDNDFELFDGSSDTDPNIIFDVNEGGNAPAIKLRRNNVTVLELDAEHNGNARVITEELEITGGSDLAEHFDVAPLADLGAPAPGMVVSIDPAQAGRLTVSATPYDALVAGVVSGAGGVRPGFLMGQDGSIADGDVPVALVGRVYVLVDASYGPVRPGDLLTTSATAGHAMRASDRARAQGAVLGKAMTGLEEGRGLVLVLVGLQ